MNPNSCLTEISLQPNIPQKFLDGRSETDQASLQGIVFNCKIALHGALAGRHKMVGVLSVIEEMLPGKFRDFVSEVLGIDMRTVRRWRQAVGTYNEIFAGPDGVRFEFAANIRQEALLRLTHADQEVKDEVKKLVEDGNTISRDDVEEITRKYRDENSKLKGELQREMKDKADQAKKHQVEMKNVQASLSAKFQELEAANKVNSYYSTLKTQSEKERERLVGQIKALEVELAHQKANPQIREVTVEVVPEGYQSIDDEVRSGERRIEEIEGHLHSLTTKRDSLEEKIKLLEGIIGDPEKGAQAASALSERVDALVKEINLFLLEMEDERNETAIRILVKIGAQFSKTGQHLTRLTGCC